MDVTLNNQQVFPVGTTVKAYPQSNWRQSQLPPSGAPKGEPDDTVFVGGSGGIEFEGLDAETIYFAAGEVSGVWHYVSFTTASPPASAEGDLELIEAHAEETTEAHGGIVSSADARLTDSRTPKAHAASHKTGGTDALAAADIGAEASANKDTDVTLAANSDVKYASQKAIKAYVDGLLAASDAVIYKGAIDCSGNPKYPAANAGHLYRVSVAGKIGGAGGVNVEIGDTLLCNTDGSAEGTHAEVGAKWNVIQVNLDGAVIGPAAAVDGNLASFSGVTGKLLKDSGLSLDTDATMAANSDTRIGSQKAVKAYVDGKVSSLGTIFVPTNYTTGIASSVPGAKAMCFVPVKITEAGKLTGIAYETGAVKNGKAIVALYDSTGKRIAKSAAAGVEQAGAENFQRLAFEAQVEVTRGVYWIGLLIESAAGTFMGAYQMSPWLKATQAEFVVPTEFAVPTEINNTGAKAPFVCTY